MTFFAVAVAGWITHQQREAIEFLKEENNILREKLGPTRGRARSVSRTLGRTAEKLLSGGRMMGRTKHVGAEKDLARRQQRRSARMVSKPSRYSELGVLKRTREFGARTMPDHTRVLDRTVSLVSMRLCPLLSRPS
jgi:hypothetical protein